MQPSTLHSPHFRLRRALGVIILLALSIGTARLACAGSAVPDLLPPVPSSKSASSQSGELERELQRHLEQLSDLWKSPLNREPFDHFADAALFYKGIIWALRYETNFGTADWELLRKAIRRGAERAQAVSVGKASWAERRGKAVRGFVSRVDGSIQPYGIVVPARYDGSRPLRLDVVLHGSSKPVGLSELRFGSRFDEGDGPTIGVPEGEILELHPLGRVENCYRWAGETDVFEAIEAVCRNYPVDRNRIVLRGMSMGASGTWHLGLKHPDRFVALGPYCGYVDTHRFSETPIPGFIKVGPLPWHQELGLHLLDSIDYAANAGVVPAIAAIGDQDVFFQAHVIMREALAREGLEMVNLISSGTGHVIDPATHREQLARISNWAAKGLDHGPRRIRFVTWTLKYNRCHWVELLELVHHYHRAEIVAEMLEDGTLEISTLRNVKRFALDVSALPAVCAKVRIEGVDVPLRRTRSGHQAQPWIFAQRAAGWRCLDSLEHARATGKSPGLQGPLDDAFASSFVCVRGTGQPWNPVVQSWAEASLRRFQYEWARYLRGDLPVKNDFELTETDLRTRHIVLFGDPGSNRWIRKALAKLPLRWDHRVVGLGSVSLAATNHAPVLITRNPLPGGQDHYLVLNSGHTFHESEFAAFNYLLFPRLGDWALIRAGENGNSEWEPSRGVSETVVRAGFFDETWRKCLNPGAEH